MSNKDYVIKQKKSPIFTIIKAIILIIVFFVMIGLENSIKTDNMCFSNIIGLDKSEENIEVTVQLISPKMESSNSVSTEDTYVTSTKAHSIDIALSKMQNYISSNIDMAHTSAIIISKELAENGVERYISTISNNLDYNNNMYILICENSAKDFIKALDESEDIEPLSYFNILKNSEDTSSSIKEVNLTDFSDKLFTTFSATSAPICKVTKKEEEIKEESSEKKDNSNDNSSSKSEKSNSNSKNSVEVDGTAIFKGEKYIGDLTSDETAFHIMLTSKIISYKTTLSSTTTNELNQDSETNIEVTQTGMANIKVNTKNNRPRIDVQIPIDITVLDTKVGSYNYLDKNYISGIKEQVTNTLDEKMKNYLNKVQKELNADIDDFYKYSRLNFLTSEEYNNYNFEEKFKDAKIDVKFKVTFNDPGLNLEK